MTGAKSPTVSVKVRVRETYYLMSCSVYYEKSNGQCPDKLQTDLSFNVVVLNKRSPIVVSSKKSVRVRQTYQLMF